MATLGRWYARPDGEWSINRYGLFDYQWVAQVWGTTPQVIYARQEAGDAWCAWLARARAIAALRRMRRDTDERMASRCGEKEATGGP